MRRHASGFTLIELMIVVAIIGTLASIAIPEFRTLQLRSRQAERVLVMQSVHRGIEDYYVRMHRYPQLQANGASLLRLDPNPDWTPGTVKRAFRPNGVPADDWRQLTITIDGAVYYSYRAWGLMDPNAAVPRSHIIQAIGDLDGDGVVDDLTKEFDFVGGGMWSPTGTLASDCSVETHLPANWAQVF